MADKNSTFIIAPSPEDQLGDKLNQWVQGIGVETIDKFTVDDALSDKNRSLLVCLGDESLSQVIEKLQLRSSPGDKVVYHIGAAKHDKNHLLGFVGIEGYLGYKEDIAFLSSPEEEPLFREAFFAGLYSLMRQETLGTAYEKIRQAWTNLTERESSSNLTFFRQMLAHELLENLIRIGDENWFLPNPTAPHLIHYNRTALPPVDDERNIFAREKPIVEVVDFSPVFLQWLEEDPTRIAKLSPDKFEDLIADRLTQIGLIVEKTGTTNTPDGGIDLIAYPKHSLFPFILAAQIKHSRVNRKVKSEVVRDFRGAITSLPIDIGMIVTNTDFTPDAEWAARQLPRLIRLRNLEDIKLWLSGKIDESIVTRDFPESIQVAPRLVIPIPRSIK